MSVFPLDPFEAAMPAAMRPLLADRLSWLRKEDIRRSGGNIQALLRGNPPMPPEIVGWAAGICFFDDHAGSYVAGIMTMYAVRPPVPFVLEAIGVGLSAGVELPLDSWKRLDALIGWAEVASLPTKFLEALPLGLMSSSAIARAAALKIARRDVKRALPIIEAARRQKLPAPSAKNLDQALEQLSPTTKTAAPASDDRLARMLAAWADTWDRRLIPAINALGAAEAARRPPLKAASKGELESAWHALASKKDPGDVDLLVNTPWPGTWRLALGRVEALEPFPIDPRIAAAMEAHTPRYASFASRPIRQAASRVVIRHRRAQVKDAPDELLREAAKFSAGASVDLAQLWKAVWELPADFARRAVLADALQSAGDPRGEFINLQLAIAEGRADAKAEQRANQLLEQHVDAWGGSLPCIRLASREFRRGFLSAVSVKADRERLRDAVDLNEWRTLERLEINGSTGDGLQDIKVLLRRTPCLRVLHFARFECDAFLTLNPVSESVTVIDADDWTPTERISGFPKLEMVATERELDFAMLFANRLGVSRVLLKHPLLGPALESFGKNARALGVHELILFSRKVSMRVTIDDPDEADLFLTGRFDADAFSKLLATLTRPRLHVHCAASARPKIEALATGRTLTFDHVPFDVFLLPRKERRAT